MTLQADLDTSNTALQSTRLMLEKGAASKDTLRALEALEKGHDCLMAKVKILYASLNIHDQFPELEGINLDFVQLLLMACDLKMNIRKWAITSFFGWDKLDRAVSGAQQALGKSSLPVICNQLTDVIQAQNYINKPEKPLRNANQPC